MFGPSAKLQLVAKVIECRRKERIEQAQTRIYQTFHLWFAAHHICQSRAGTASNFFSSHHPWLPPSAASLSLRPNPKDHRMAYLYWWGLYGARMTILAQGLKVGQNWWYDVLQWGGRTSSAVRTNTGSCNITSSPAVNQSNLPTQSSVLRTVVPSPFYVLTLRTML